MKIKLGECFGGSGNNPNLRTFGSRKIRKVVWCVFFGFGRGPDLETRDGFCGMFFFLGGKKKVHEFSGNVCVFFLFLWKLIEDQLGVDVTTP